MLRADIPQRRHSAFFRMVETEAAFIHHAARLRIAVVIAAPHGRHPQFLEAPPEQAAHRLGSQSPAPVRPAYPVAYLGLVLPYSGNMRSPAKQDARASDWPAAFLQNNGVCLRCGKHGADDIQTVFHGSVRRPACGRAYLRITGISEQRPGIAFLPGTQYEPC